MSFAMFATWVFAGLSAGFAYIPSPYREETVNFIVSIGGQ